VFFDLLIWAGNLESSKSMHLHFRFSKTTSPIFSHPYSFNHFKESLENCSEDLVTNIAQTSCGLKEFGIMVIDL